MEWTSRYDSTRGIVSAVVRGTYRVDPANALLRELLALAQQHGATRFLVDLSAAKLDMTTIEIRERPRQYEALGFGRKSRMAVVFPEWTIDAVFLQATIDRGEYPRKVFVDAKQAIEWLLSDRA